MNKVRIIINKHVKCALTSKDILDGIATYSSPDLKMFDELFPSSEMQYFILPFDQENYTKYIEMMFKYSNVFTSFSKEFKSELLQIVNSIYPIGLNIKTNEENRYKKPVANVLNIFKKNKIIEMKSENSGFEKVIDVNTNNTENKEGE